MCELIKTKFIFDNLATRIFGDNINTDQLHSPSKFAINKDALRSDYINNRTKKDSETAVKNIIESIVESLTGLNSEKKKKAKSIVKAEAGQDDDTRNLLIIAGYNFGIGSSRFSTPLALKNEGVKCVAALSISRIFERNLAAAGIFPLTISGLNHGAKYKDIINCKVLSASVKIKTGKNDRAAAAEIKLTAGSEIITLTAGMDMFLYAVAASGGMVNYVAND